MKIKLKIEDVEKIILEHRKQIYESITAEFAGRIINESKIKPRYGRTMEEEAAEKIKDRINGVGYPPEFQVFKKYSKK